VEIIFSKASSTLFITAGLRRSSAANQAQGFPGTWRLFLRLRAPASASGTASANSSVIPDRSLQRSCSKSRDCGCRESLPGVFRASTAIFKTLLPPRSMPAQQFGRTPRSCKACSTQSRERIASACSTGACSSRERSFSRGSRLGNSRGWGRAMFFLLAFSCLNLTSPFRNAIVCALPFRSTSTPSGALDGRSGGLCAAADVVATSCSTRR